jgi:hypothetical protein
MSKGLIVGVNFAKDTDQIKLSSNKVLLQLS